MASAVRSLNTMSVLRRTGRLQQHVIFRGYATPSQAHPVTAPPQHHKALVIGAGTAGLTVSHQLLRTGRFGAEDVAAIDPAEWHHYQPGWTLVGAGLKAKEDLRRPVKSLIDPQIKFYNNSVATISPTENLITLGSGSKISYDHLVIAPGIALNPAAVQGLPEALANPDSNVSSTYSYDTVSKVWDSIQQFKKGDALFTQPTGVVKCAGGPQKIMWLAADKWKKAGIFNPQDLSSSPAKISFATGLPVMFGVPKYNKRLDALREERNIEGLFEHDLVSIEGNTATFARPQGQESVKKHFDFLHVVPKMDPHSFIKNSPVANAAGFVDVEDGTLQHKKFPNVWSCGDASSLPTSKTAAAVTAQVPVLVRNLLDRMDGKEGLSWKYDGYTSCPLLTEYGKVMLCEFGYGGQPKETFARFGIDQAQPKSAFYYLKKDFFPWVYYKSFVKGTWGGPKGWLRS